MNGNECVNNWTLGFGVQNDYVNTSHKDITILIDRIIYKRLNWILQSKMSLFWVYWDWFIYKRLNWILQSKMSLFWVYWDWFDWNESRIWLSYSILFSNTCIHSHFLLVYYCSEIINRWCLLFHLELFEISHRLSVFVSKLIAHIMFVPYPPFIHSFIISISLPSSLLQTLSIKAITVTILSMHSKHGCGPPS